MNNIILPLSLLSAIQCSSPIAIQQILSQMFHTLGFETSKKLLLRILPLLSPQQSSLLQSLY